MLPITKRILLCLTFAVLLFGAVQPASANHLPNTAPNPSYIPIGTNEFSTDSEVTVVGRGAWRAQRFLDWTLVHGNVPRAGYKPIEVVFLFVQQSAYALSILVVVFVGFLLMIRRDKDIKLMRFLPLFIAILIYIFFSYAITKLVYQFVESLMRSFFVLSKDANNNYEFITSQNLLHVGFDYVDFIGKRRIGENWNESALISMLLVRMTTWTYMVMSGILILREVILWFFIIISPFLGLLIPFPLIRNTGKIWIGEFFRWLFYGLLFAVFLRGLVEMWRYNIPLQFRPDDAGQANWDVVYPTSINILLAGPNYTTNGEDLSSAAITSVNNIDTYANYVVALIMLWVVIILPWILLRIFRDMFANWLKSDSANNLLGQLGTLYTRFSPITGGGGGGSALGLPGAHESVPPSTPPSTPPPGSAGQALTLPFRQVTMTAHDVDINQDFSRGDSISIENQMSKIETNNLPKIVNVSIPRMVDIAKMEMNTNNLSQQWTMLQKLGNPNLAATPVEMQKVSAFRSELTRRARAGDQRAQSILSAAQSTSSVSVQNITNITNINNSASNVNNANATNIANRTAGNEMYMRQELAQGAQRATAAINAATNQTFNQMNMNSTNQSLRSFTQSLRNAATTMSTMLVGKTINQSTINQAAQKGAQVIAMSAGGGVSPSVTKQAADKGAQTMVQALISQVGVKTNQATLAAGAQGAPGQPGVATSNGASTVVVQAQKAAGVIATAAGGQGGNAGAPGIPGMPGLPGSRPILNATVIASASQKAATVMAAEMGISPDAGNPNAAKVVAQAHAPGVMASKIMPTVNRVQQVSLEDYQEVKEMWLEHYRKGQIPAGLNVKNKAEWLQMDIEKAETAIAMIGNINPEVKQKGLEMVAALLPFLLLGGFSEQETITYLKAKVEAAKQILGEIEAKEQGVKEAKEQDEEESLEVSTGHATAEQHLEAEIDEDKPHDQADSSSPSNLATEQPSNLSNDDSGSPSNPATSQSLSEVEGPLDLDQKLADAFKKERTEQELNDDIDNALAPKTDRLENPEDDQTDAAQPQVQKQEESRELPMDDGTDSDKDGLKIPEESKENASAIENQSLEAAVSASDPLMK